MDVDGKLQVEDRLNRVITAYVSKTKTNLDTFEPEFHVDVSMDLTYELMQDANAILGEDFYKILGKVILNKIKEKGIK